MPKPKRSLQNELSLVTTGKDTPEKEGKINTSQDTISSVSTTSNTNSSGTRSILRSQTLSPKSSVQFATQPRKHQSFLKVRLEVQAHPEGATGVSQALGTLLGILQAADKTTQLAIYKGGLLSPEKDAIDKAAAIPKQITAFQKYAYRAKPNKSGGTTWTNIKILHDGDIQEILADIKEECQDSNIGISLQSIQHHNVQSIGWLLHLHDKVDLEFWQNFFDEQLVHRKHDKGLIGLTLRKPYDGIKQDNTKDKMANRAIHVETVGEKGDAVKKDIKAILRSPAFKKLYIPDVRLIPPFDKYSQTQKIQEKIRQCILIQNQFSAQVTLGDLELSNIDYPLESQKGATLRELILRIKNKDKRPLFIGVERRWNKQGFQVLYPEVYMAEAMEYIKHLPFYLVRLYGSKLKETFDSHTQHTIANTKWDHKEQRAISEEDAELEDTQDLHTNMTWFSFTPEVAAELKQKQTQEEIDTTDAQGGKITVHIDKHGDVSTFATVTEVKQSKIADSGEPKDLRDDVSAVTPGSYETRMTSVEEKLGNFDTKLDITTKQLQNSIDLIIQKMDINTQEPQPAQGLTQNMQHFSPAETSCGSKRSAESASKEETDVHRQDLQGRRRSKRVLVINQAQPGTVPVMDAETVSKPGEAETSSGTT